MSSKKGTAITLVAIGYRLGDKDHLNVHYLEVVEDKNGEQRTTGEELIFGKKLFPMTPGGIIKGKRSDVSYWGFTYVEHWSNQLQNQRWAAESRAAQEKKKLIGAVQKTQNFDALAEPIEEIRWAMSRMTPTQKTAFTNWLLIKLLKG